MQKMKRNLKKLKLAKLSSKVKRSAVKTAQRFLAFAMVTVMLIGIMPPADAYRWDTVPDCPEFSEIIWQSTQTADDGFTGTVKYTEGQNGNCYALGGTTYLQQLIKNFTEEEQSREYFKDNTMLFSIDLCAQQTDHALIFAINNYPLLMFNGKGKLSFVNQVAWPGAEYVGDVSMDYEANKWYNIKLLIDGNLKRISCYVNGEFWGNDSHKSAGFFNKDLDPSLTMENFLFNTHTEMTFKNGVLTRSDGSGMFLIDNITFGYPSRSDVSLEAKTDEMGNMLVCGDTPVYLDVCNNEDTAKEFTVEYEIRDAENYIHANDSVNVSVKGNTTERVTVNPKLEKCGFYYIKATMYDKNGTVDKLKTRFSVIAKAKQNPRFGFSVHPKTHGHGTVEEINELTVKLGGGVNREDFGYWNNEKTNKGNVSFVEKSYENNIEPLMIIGPGDSGLSGSNWPPSEEILDTTDALTVWENYCRDFAEYMGGGDKAIYEVINEWLVSERKTNSTPEAYARILKATTKGLRAGNPDCVIVGLCGALNSAESWWDDRVLAALGDNPGQYFDAISVHPYHVWGDLYPEESKIEDMQIYTDILKKYGLEDIPIYGTEYGCTVVNQVTDIDNALQADFVLREFIMMNDFIEKHYFYTITRKRDSTGRESGFGITKSPTNEEIIYEAYPAALTYAMWNSLMVGAHITSYKIFDFGNEDISDDLYAYNFDLENGKKCIAMWNVDGETTQSVDVGAETVTVYDGYGNKKTVSAVDGYITLKFTGTPLFIVANSLTEPQLRETPLIEFDSIVTTMLNNAGEVKVSNNTTADLTVEAETSANITEAEDTCAEVKAESTGRVVFKTGYDREKTEEYIFDDENGLYDGMRIILKDGGKVVFDESVKVRYEDSLQTNLSIIPYKSGIWQAISSVRNTNKLNSNNGKLELLNGDKVVYSRDIEDIAPGEKRIYRYIVPEELVGDSLKLTARVEAEDGQQFEKTVDNKLAIITKADEMPTIDGIMEAGEWQTFSGPFKMNSSEYAEKLKGWKGVNDLSGDIYLMYDENYLYFAAKIKDDIHCGYDAQNRIWAMDSIQFAVTDARVGDAKITEMGFGLTDEGPKYERYLSQYTGTDGFELNKFNDEVEFAATIDENITTYEFKMSWRDLFKNNYVPTEYLIFSVLVNDNDGEGRRGWMEYGSGIGSSKDSSKFLEIPLMK